jgi:Gpi18-like mannosyltransferase
MSLPGWRDLLAALTLAAIAWALALLAYRGDHVAQLTMATPNSILPRTAFHDLERFPETNLPFRWTTGASRLRPANPGGRVALTLRMVGGPAGRTALTVVAGGERYELAVAPEPRRYHMLLPPSTQDRLTLELRSPTVEVRDRHLGVMVADMQVAGGGSAPLIVQVALLLAALLLFALLRQARWGLGLACGATLLLVSAAALWQSADGWVYAISVPLLGLVGAASLTGLVLNRWQLPAVAAAPAPAAERQAGSIAVVAGVVGCALIVRLAWLAAPDPVGDLELAARRMWLLSEGGLAGAYRFGGDYMPLRLFLLWLLSGLVEPLGGSFFTPLPGVTKALIKLPQLLADLGIVATIVIWGQRQGARWWATLVALVYAVAPAVWINVAWWGQVDALLMLPVVLALLLFERAEGRWSWALWAIALLIKPQAIVFAPVLLLAAVRRYGSRGLAGGGIVALLVVIAGCLPLFLAGQGYGLTEAYMGSVGRFPRTTYGAYNLWHLALGGRVTEDSELVLPGISYRIAGLGLLGVATLLALSALWRRSDAVGRVRSAALLALSFFLLPTQIHERYLFLALPLLALWATSDRRMLLALVVLIITATLNIVGVLNGFWPDLHALLDGSSLTVGLAALNLGVLIALTAVAQPFAAAPPAPLPAAHQPE